MKNNKVLFISSTGGHLTELLQLKKIFNNYDYHIITEKTKTNEHLKDKYGEKIDYLVYGTKKNLFTYLFIHTYNWFKSLILFFRIRPEVVVTTGTHTAVPMCFISKIFGAKVIYIETFANRNTKTMAGKILYPFVDVFVVQWENMLKLYPKAEYWGGIF